MFPLCQHNDGETFVSRGPGRIQQTITELIASDPHGAWTVGQLCERIYPDELLIRKKHRVAVARALRRMNLPSTWGVRMGHRQGSEYCLYDKCDEESTSRADYLGWWRRSMFDFWTWRERYKHRIDEVAQTVKEARLYRDASPIGKLDIEIADLNRRIGYAGIACISAAPFRQKIAELEAKNAALEREAADVQ
jgi:hypothetical protein